LLLFLSFFYTNLFSSSDEFRHFSAEADGQENAPQSSHRMELPKTWKLTPHLGQLGLPNLTALFLGRSFHCHDSPPPIQL
jgi:hypothetical protein